MNTRGKQIEDLIKKNLCINCPNFNMCWVEGKGPCFFFLFLKKKAVFLKNKSCEKCPLYENCFNLCFPLKNKIINMVKHEKEKVDDEEDTI